MSRGKSKSPGWAAFDLKHRQKQGLDFDPHIPEEDPFPPIRSSLTPPDPTNIMPFSSLLIPSLDNGNRKKTATTVGDSSNNFVQQDDRVLAVQKLKELHRWADNSLLEDVLAAADDNVDSASAFLKAMFPINDTLEDEPTVVAETNYTSNELCGAKRDQNDSLGNTMSLADRSSTLEDSLQYKSHESEDQYFSFGEKLSDDTKLILERLKSVPVEPEWEEDDIYLIHRKDALKTIRSASQHSRASTNAFLRGDHLSAQHHSMKAHEEWLAAERLNAKAAKEIFSIRNSKKNIWKLDLHGLHASEAIRALQERLQQIETQVQPNHSVSQNRVDMKSGIVCSSSLESFNCLDTEDLDIQQMLSRQRPASLQVITGIGNHSKGHAAIPTAVRSYLDENRYHFHELRPGVVTVQTKFRQR
ncbi:uncharacterized protein LOC122297128 [Carya illinoinensis]|uniref:Smr domain-containing protein n=1 Tax=Carya illinoinensis TaxID=32201 RepID=A0A8T1NEC4_CARIL|nr:uncharacterized protein LOC122297128 [Carya illinoinensis]KAG6628212.1 hypothetical protein CIPAW_15G186200 [Carya illinoinensis]KAG6676831.1 hypothetical protein I3842_15G170200 [Carya illinoinensis]